MHTRPHRRRRRKVEHIGTLLDELLASIEAGDKSAESDLTTPDAQSVKMYQPNLVGFGATFDMPSTALELG